MQFSLPSSRTVAALALLVVSCGPAGPRERFESDVVPILEGYCLAGACHGVLPDAEARGEVINWEFFHIRVHEDLRIVDVDEAYEMVKSRINTIERAEFSSLLRKPLAPSAGGLIHRGGEQFAHGGTAPYRQLLAWIESESGGGEGADRAELTANEERFASEVLPHLAARQCLNQSCHGPTAPFTSFEPPLEIDGQSLFSVAAMRKNYRSARLHLFLGGEVGLSRLIRKALPLDRGGVAHRGGNDIFFSGPDDAPAVAIAGWAEAERAEVFAPASPEVTGVVFVRGPLSASRPFSPGTPEPFTPGSDLYVLEPATPDGVLRNLTAAVHPDGPVEIRDPAVNHDGDRIAFAMRSSGAEAFNLYEIGVAGGGFRQLTFDPRLSQGGALIGNIEPTYGPDGRIFFVSSRAGVLADGLDIVDTDIWAVDPDSGEMERLTYDPSPAATPSFIPTGKTYGTLAFTMRRTIGDRYEAPVFRFPLDHNRGYHGDPEIHIHHGITVAEDILRSMRTMPDGRFSGVLLDRDNMWRGGRLAIFDRQFGPEMPRGDENQAAVGGFRHAFTVVDQEVAASGPSAGGFYRHPVPLPDGRLLTTYAPGPVDLSDPAAVFDIGIYALEIAEDRQTAEPQLRSRTALIDEPGVAEYDAEPIVTRPLEDDPDHEPAWDAEREMTTGLVAFRHVETLEAIFSNLSQRGEKTLRDDLVYARLLEAVPVTPQQYGEARIGLGVHGRTRILGEVALAGGSLYLEVPADRPFRVQFLDGERMAVGAQHNRWNHVAPGETFPGGVSPTLYPSLCAGCHGSLSGDPGDVGGPISDAITAASVTLATHDNLNPRRPLAPTSIGDDSFTTDYRRDIAPLIARSCAVADCHGGADPAGGLNLDAVATGDFDSAYEALLAPGWGSGEEAGPWGVHMYVDSTRGSARRSYLIERIYGRELDAPRALEQPCPGDPELSVEERLLFVRWIDQGAVYRGEPE